MLPLKKLQQLFADGLYEKANGILRYIRGTPTMPPEQHFAVYKSSTMGALQKGLKEIYPVCFRLVGEEFFISMVNDYIALTPSMSPDLGDFGKTLPEFIAEFSPALTIPYLPDIARLEWAWHRLQHAEKSGVLDFDKLALFYETRGENILFTLPTDCTLLFSHFPAHHIWEMNQDDYTGPETLTLGKDETFFYFVWRSETGLHIDILPHAEWQILFWVQQKFTLGQIAEFIDAYLPNTDLVQALIKFSQMGWLCGFSLVKI